METTAAPSDVKPLVKMNLDKITEGVSPPSDPSQKGDFYREQQKRAEEGEGIFNKAVLNFIKDIPDSHLPKDGRRFFIKWVANGIKEDPDLSNDDVMNATNYWEILGRTESMLKDSFGSVTRGISKFKEFFNFLRRMPSNILPDKRREEFVLWLGDQYIGNQNIDEERVRFIRDFFIGRDHNPRVLDGDFEEVFDRATQWHDNISKVKVHATKYLTDLSKSVVYSGYGMIIVELSTRVESQFVLANDCAFEGKSMRNCIGSIHKPYIMKGTETIYSLREPSPPNKPRVSVSYSEGKFIEAKEFANKPISDPKYALPVYDFLSKKFPADSWTSVEGAAWVKIPEVLVLLKENLGEDEFGSLLFKTNPSYDMYAEAISSGKTRDLASLDFYAIDRFYKTIPDEKRPEFAAKFPGQFLRSYLADKTTERKDVIYLLNNADTSGIKDQYDLSKFRDLSAWVNNPPYKKGAKPPETGWAPGWFIKDGIANLSDDISTWPEWFFSVAIRDTAFHEEMSTVISDNIDKIYQMDERSAVMALRNPALTKKIDLELVPNHIVESTSFRSDDYSDYLYSLDPNQLTPPHIQYLANNISYIQPEYLFSSLEVLEKIQSKIHAQYVGHLQHQIYRNANTAAAIVQVLNNGIFEKIIVDPSIRHNMIVKMASKLKKNDIKKIVNMPPELQDLINIKHADPSDVSKYQQYLKGFRSPRDFEQEYFRNEFLNYMVKKMPVELIPRYIRANLTSYSLLTSILPRSPETSDFFLKSDVTSIRALAARYCNPKLLKDFVKDRSWKVRKSVAERIDPKYLPQMTNDRDNRVQSVVHSRLNNLKISSVLHVAIDLFRGNHDVWM